MTGAAVANKKGVSMAYVGHSSHWDLRDVRGVVTAIANPSLLARCALVAAIAAIAVLALSGVSGMTVAPDKKGDRLVAATAVQGAPGAYIHDPATRTTTVERGATVPLSPDSPMAPAVR